MKISITCITPVLQAILDFFPDIISFQHVFHLGVGRSQIEWKLKAKTQILVFPWAKIGQNDHSNPYIESTTVLSDIVRFDGVPRNLEHLLRTYGAEGERKSLYKRLYGLLWVSVSGTLSTY